MAPDSLRVDQVRHPVEAAVQTLRAEKAQMLVGEVVGRQVMFFHALRQMRCALLALRATGQDHLQLSVAEVRAQAVLVSCRTCTDRNRRRLRELSRGAVQGVGAALIVLVFEVRTKVEAAEALALAAQRLEGVGVVRLVWMRVVLVEEREGHLQGQAAL